LTRTSGTLYVVATPIGNLADSSPRSIEVLRAADIVACEDTRTSRTLLAHHGIAARTVALHAHNERQAGEKLLRALREGSNVALVSDAGTPGVSDPGALLVEAAHREGLRVVAVPGPNAAVAAYSAAGFASGRFLFAGFLPGGSKKARSVSLDGLDMPWPVILYEAREQRLHRQQGEFVLVLGPGEQNPAGLAEGERLFKILLEKMPASDAAKLAARITGLPRNALYRVALGPPAGGSK